MSVERLIDKIDGKISLSIVVEIAETPFKVGLLSIKLTTQR